MTNHALKNVFAFQGAQEHILIVNDEIISEPKPLYASNSLNYVRKFFEYNEGRKLLNSIAFYLVYYTEEFGIRVKKIEKVSQSLALNWLSNVPHLNEAYKNEEPDKCYRYKEDEGTQLTSDGLPFKDVDLYYPVYSQHHENYDELAQPVNDELLEED